MIVGAFKRGFIIFNLVRSIIENLVTKDLLLILFRDLVAAAKAGLLQLSLLAYASLLGLNGGLWWELACLCTYRDDQDP